MKHTITILGAIVSAAGAMVIAGWILQVDALKSVLPGMVTMKGSTAVCFFLTGLTMICFRRAVRGNDWAQLIVVVTCLWNLALMANVLYDFAGGQPFEESDYVTQTTAPGIPSLGTVICFVLSALVGIYVIWQTEHLFFLTKFSGLAIASMGLLATLGYMFDVEVMYYYIPSVSTAMALHTSILFVMVGTGFALIKPYVLGVYENKP